MLKKYVKDNVWFLLPWLLFVITCSYFCIAYNKVDLHLLSNQFVGGWSDTLFLILTSTGDGLIIIFAILVLLFFNTRMAIQLAIIFVISTIIAHLFKDVLMVHMYRPYYVFNHLHIKLKLISGMYMNEVSSFPSGHSMTAFSLLAFFAFYIRQNYIKFIFCITAILIAYSRVYLSQHFLMDILAGALIGVVTVVLVMAYSNISMKYNMPLRSYLKLKKETGAI
ncbi:MAG TPA: phosphatase PAP2 family protein [Ferruginibacter sp.]|nr:phosphatase PAP2 family protein [Ferruginibacter sp.]